MDPQNSNNQDNNQSFQLPDRLKSIQSDLQQAGQDATAVPPPQPGNTHQIQGSGYSDHNDAQNAINQAIQEHGSVPVSSDQVNQPLQQPQPVQSSQPTQPPQTQAPAQPSSQQPQPEANNHPPIHTFKRRTKRDPEAAAKQTPTDPGSMQLPPRVGATGAGVTRSSIPPPPVTTSSLSDIPSEELQVADSPDSLPGLSFKPEVASNDGAPENQENANEQPMESALSASKELTDDAQADEQIPSTNEQPEPTNLTVDPTQPTTSPAPEPQNGQVNNVVEDTTPKPTETPPEPQQQPPQQQLPPQTTQDSQQQNIDLQEPEQEPKAPEAAPQPSTPPGDTYSFTETIKPTEAASTVTRMDEPIDTPQTKSMLGSFKTKAAEQGAKAKKINYKPLVSAGIFGIFVFILFNSQVILGQVQYLTTPSGGLEAPIDLTDPSAASGDAQNIIIPKINVDIPVVYDISTFEESAVQAGLERGVVHYGNTAMPGEVGNTVIVGHSSHNWWDSGQYKFAFILLDRLEIGDQVILNYEGTRYVYEIRDKFVVEPTNVSVLNQPNDESMLTLITCTPPGTSWQRLIVQAEQISPDPSDNTEAEDRDIESVDQLPRDGGGGVRGFLGGLFSD